MNKFFGTLTCTIIFSISFMTLPAQIKNPRNTVYNWKTDTTKRNIDLSEITLVLPRESFPAIDFPGFINKDLAFDSFFKHEPVISVEINGKAKAYPLNMLTMHEISNDSLGGVPILPSYCPLCNSSMVYDRRIKHNGKEILLNFEVSGMLRNSDMVMADKQTETWWQQLTGEAIVGELTNIQLDIIPSLVISVEEFFNRYPKGLILSPQTGTKSESRYGINPYVSYDDEAGKPREVFFEHSNIDDRLPAMERLIDIKGENGYKVYPFSLIQKHGVIHDHFDGTDIVIFHQEGTVSVLDTKEIAKAKSIGSATVFRAELDGETMQFKKVKNGFKDLKTQSLWDITGYCTKGRMKGKSLQPVPHSNHFAFAFLRFHPDALIYNQK